MLPAAGGLALGVPAGLLGVQASPRIASYLLRVGVQEMPLPTALRWLPYLNDHAFMARTCGLALGLAGFALGAALLYPTRDSSQ